MTPWKAQGMTLDRAVVRLTRAAASPGVAFVALSRVRHPDHLMLEDSFPDMATIMRQSEKEAFVARQRWERRMRVQFSRTIRAHMRDPELFSSNKSWSAEESALADMLLETVRKNTELADDAVVAKCCRENASIADLEEVWEKLHTFPHMFEIAAARGTLMDYDLNGERKTKKATVINHVTYRRWKVVLSEYDLLLQKGTLEASMFELLANVLRLHLPRDGLYAPAT